jgi:hypothetical protein
MTIKKQSQTAVLCTDGSSTPWCSNCGHSPVVPNKPCSHCGAMVQRPKCKNKKSRPRIKSLREFQMYYDY